MTTDGQPSIEQDEHVERALKHLELNVNPRK